MKGTAATAAGLGTVGAHTVSSNSDTIASHTSRLQGSDSYFSDKTTSYTLPLSLRARAQVCWSLQTAESPVSPTNHPEDVPKPIDFGLEYEEPELVTPDGVKLRCYLLTLKKDLRVFGGSVVDSPEQSDEEVRFSYLTV